MLSSIKLKASVKLYITCVYMYAYLLSLHILITGLIKTLKIASYLWIIWYHQSWHFLTGFILDPFWHLKATANSSLFTRVPNTLSHDMSIQSYIHTCSQEIPHLTGSGLCSSVCTAFSKAASLYWAHHNYVKKNVMKLELFSDVAV